jgi:hypothetical protein
MAANQEELERNEWLRRYRARWLERRPSLTTEEIDEFADIEAHEALSADYPDNPEQAVDDEITQWPESGK